MICAGTCVAKVMADKLHGRFSRQTDVVLPHRSVRALEAVAILSCVPPNRAAKPYVSSACSGLSFGCCHLSTKNETKKAAH